MSGLQEPWMHCTHQETGACSECFRVVIGAVERLTRERDEARASATRGWEQADSLHMSVAEALRERDEARAEAKEWQQHAALEPERAAVSMQRWMDITKQQQANAEKAEARVAELEAALRDIVAIGERCNCDGYCGPCGCGERAEDVAREALGEVES